MSSNGSRSPAPSPPSPGSSCSTNRWVLSTASCGNAWSRELRALFVSLAVTALFVTHDQDEAFALADRIVIMRGGNDRADRRARGRVAHAGHRVRGPIPRLRQRGRRDGRAGRDPQRLGPDPAPGPRRRRAAAATPAGPVRLAARPDALRLDPNGPVRGRVVATTFRRDHFLVQVETDLGVLEVAATTPPTAGENVGLSLDPNAAVTLDA